MTEDLRSPVQCSHNVFIHISPEGRNQCPSDVVPTEDLPPIARILPVLQISRPRIRFNLLAARKQKRPHHVYVAAADGNSRKSRNTATSEEVEQYGFCVIVRSVPSGNFAESRRS